MSLYQNFMKTLEKGGKNPLKGQGGFTFGKDILQEKMISRLSLFG